MARQKQKNSKTKVVQVRLTKGEFDSYKFRVNQFQKRTGIKINTSELIRHVLERADNLQFLQDIGYISYLDAMSGFLFEHSKYPRAKKCRK